MPYPFCFCSYTDLALLDSGVDQTLVNSSFVDKFKLATNPSQIKNVVSADEHHITVTREATPFSVMLENLHSTIQGPVIDFSKFDIVLGLDCLQKNNPHLDLATSVLTIKFKGVNHQIYPDSVVQLLRNHIFVRITETLDKRENLKTINWDSCQYKSIHFKDHQDTITPQDCKIVAHHPEIFKEALPRLPLEKHIQHSIQLKGAVVRKRLTHLVLQKFLGKTLLFSKILMLV
ncbi:hypothetical protein DSO57_1021725 [Entomophthora muscae]|uniref:Uncharacterized protein n=1 Tax=Entomophthora muscae TaxID=34485 RepID=A0ACC2UN76_9FUNG|nr:hypothetical protein DSO57_1021725 [Entomophthora muscae]